MFSNKFAAAALAGFISLCTPASAQWLPLAEPIQSCSAATTFLARTSGLSATETKGYTLMICAMVNDGTWSMLDFLYIFATNNTTTAALNLVSTSYGATVNGTLTFSADHGWTGNGSTGYLDTGFNPSTAGSPNYTLNSAHLSAYTLTNRTASHNYVSIGSSTTTGTSYSYIDPRYTGGAAWEINAVTNNSGIPASAYGMAISTRTMPSASSYFQNGSQLFTDMSGSSVAVPNSDILVFALYDAGSIDTYSADQLGEASGGAGFTFTQAVNFMSDVNLYMKALGINAF